MMYDMDEECAQKTPIHVNCLKRNSCAVVTVCTYVYVQDKVCILFEELPVYLNEWLWVIKRKFYLNHMKIFYPMFV